MIKSFPISRVLGFKGNLIFKCCRNGVFWDCPGDRKRCQHCEKGKLVKTPECVCSCEHVLISFTAIFLLLALAMCPKELKTEGKERILNEEVGRVGGSF